MDNRYNNQFSNLFSLLKSLKWFPEVNPPTRFSPELLDSRKALAIKLIEKDDVDWKLWNETVGRLLERKLHYARYSKKALERSLDFFHQNVLPYLGSFPTSIASDTWWSFMTDDHTPVELSWDWGKNSNAPRIRYSLDPISFDSGTPKDPTNLITTTHFYKNVIQGLPNVNLVWYEHSAQEFETLKPGAIDRSGRLTRAFYAFGVQPDGDTVPKA